MRTLLETAEELRRGERSIKDVVVIDERDLTAGWVWGFEGVLEACLQKTLSTIDQIGRLREKSQQLRQEYLAILRNQGPEEGRRLKFALARTRIETSRLIRSIAFTPSYRDLLIDKITEMVQSLRQVEKEIARLQREIGPSPGEPDEDTRRELQELQRKAARIEGRAETNSAELRLTLHIIEVNRPPAQGAFDRILASLDQRDREIVSNHPHLMARLGELEDLREKYANAEARLNEWEDWRAANWVETGETGPGFGTTRQHIAVEQRLAEVWAELAVVRSELEVLRATYAQAKESNERWQAWHDANWVEGETEGSGCTKAELELRRQLAAANNRITELQAIRRTLSGRMTYRESLKVAWLWVWRGRALTIGAIACGLIVLVPFATTIRDNSFTAFSSPLVLYLLMGALLLITAPFAVQPWTAQMMVRKQYQGFGIEVQRPGAAATRDLSYREAIAVAWLLLWRSALLNVIAEFACCWLMISVIRIASLELTGENVSSALSPLDHLDKVGVAAAQVLGIPISILVVYPWVVRMLLKKKFRGFSLCFVR